MLVIKKHFYLNFYIIKNYFLLFLSKKGRFGGAKGKKLAKECTSVAYARMRPINAPIAPRNIAQGRRREGIEQRNHPARLRRRPFRPSRNP